MTDTSPTDLSPTWNLTPQRWQQIAGRCRAFADILEDGAYVRCPADPASTEDELHFYATSFQKPDGWRFPFLEPIPDARPLGAFVGRAWHDPASGFVHFEVILYAAAQALRADYESDVSDLDYVTYEQAVEQAVRGTDKDLHWLHREFSCLAAAVPP